MLFWWEESTLNWWTISQIPKYSFKIEKSRIRTVVGSSDQRKAFLTDEPSLESPKYSFKIEKSGNPVSSIKISMDKNGINQNNACNRKHCYFCTQITFTV